MVNQGGYLAVLRRSSRRLGRRSRFYEAVVAPLSSRQRWWIGGGLLLLGLGIVFQITYASDSHQQTLMRSVAAACQADSGWAQAEQAAGQPTASPDQTAGQIDAAASAVWSGGAGQLVCHDFPLSSGPVSAMAVSLNLHINQQSTDVVGLPPAVEPAEQPAAIDRRTEPVPANAYGNQSTPSADDVLAVEVSLDGRTWQSLHRLGSTGVNEPAEHNILLPPELSQLDALQIRLTPLVEGTDAGSAIVENVSLTYLAGAPPELSLELVGDYARPSGDQPPLVNQPELRFRLNAKPAEDGVWQGLGRSVSALVDEAPPEPAIDAAAALSSSQHDFIPQDVELVWDGYNLDGSASWLVNTTLPSSLDSGTISFELSVKDDSGSVQNVAQDFLWGVLAFNTDRSSYQPGQTADFGFAVLDENGSVVCDAQLELELSGALSRRLSTAEGTIALNQAACDAREDVGQADYSARLELPADLADGEVTMKLAADTDNGRYQVTDRFFIQKDPAVEVARRGPTRIFPPSIYSMDVTVTANRGFEGTVIEPVPNSFAIIDSGGGQVVDNGSGRHIEWQLSLAAGDSRTLSYRFDAADITPEFWLVGPLRLEADGQSVFNESRQWQVASDAVEITIDDTVQDATMEFNASPNTVFIDATTGYVFYIDATARDLAYRKTTDGGTSWDEPVVIDTSRNWANVAVWYDQWTPGDNSGTVIHLAAAEVNTDDSWYTNLDTAGDVVLANEIMIMASTNFAVSADGPPSITKNGAGNLFASQSFTNPVGNRVAKSTDGGASWSDATPSGWSGASLDQVQLLPLVSDDDVLAIKVNTAADTIESRVYDEVGDAWDGSWTTIGTLVESTTYDQSFSAVMRKSNGSVYLAFANATATAGNDLEFWTYTDTGRIWTQNSNILTDDATSMMPSLIVDDDVGTVYAGYLRGTVGANVNVHYRRTVDGGTTWSAEAARINTITDDHKVLRSNFSSSEIFYLTWFNDDLNDLVGNQVPIDLVTGETNIDDTIFDATDEFNSGPSSVFVSKNVGYIFYVDADSQDLAYRKTIDGGASWGLPVVIDTNLAWTAVAIWYDRWTPGDNTGTLIHLHAVEDGTDDTFYSYLDTANDTLRSSLVTVIPGTNFAEAASGPPSITKNGQGYLFASSNFNNPAGGRVYKSINDGAAWTNATPAGWSTTNIDQFQVLPLLTDDDIVAIRANTGGNTIESRVYDEAADTWAGAWTTIATLTESTTYDQWFSASLRKSSGDILLTFANATAAAGNDIEFWTFTDAGRNWSQNADVLTDDATSITPAAMVDQATGDLYVAYLRGTVGATMNLYFKSSTDGGATWSAESDSLNAVADDLRYVRGNLLNDQRLFAVWYNDDLDDILGATIANLFPGVEQAGYRFYANQDAADVGSPLASLNTPATLTSHGQAFRLRTLAHMDTRDLEIDSRQFRLQYAGMGSGTCAAPSGGNPAVYKNVNLGSLIAYNNNPSPGDGDALVANANDPTHGGHSIAGQTYEELNNFSNSQSAVSAGDDALWDFSLRANGAPAGTTYCLRIVRANGSPLETYGQYAQVTTYPNTPPDDPDNLVQLRTNDTAVATGGWTNETDIKFTLDASDDDNPDQLQLCVEVDLLAVAFSDTEDSCSQLSDYTGGTLSLQHQISGLSPGNQYHWQARVRDTNNAVSAWVSYGGNPQNQRDFGIDTANPSGTVYDGTAEDVDIDINNGSLDSLSANWDGADADSGIAAYDYSVGTTPGGTEVLGWTANGLSDSATAGSLNLRTGQIYYFNVRISDGAGNQTTISTDGILVAPTLSFSTAPGSVEFGNLNSANGYTSVVNTTLTTSTNAFGGYIVRAFINQLPTSQSADAIPLFSGGSYASPDAWLGGDTGYGYTSNDSLVDGLNRFGSTPCAGGGSPPCYAPFATAAPGDIVVDHTDPIQGLPLTNQNFIVTHRVTTAPAQPAGTYTTLVIYTVMARY